VAIYLDDIHWADEGSLDLIDHLARMCSDVPLLIVCLTRPSLFRRRPSWGERWTAHTRLELSPLSKQNSRRLVLEILQKAPEIPPILRELVAGRAEGNPFYIEELVKVLIDDGIIVAGADRWEVEVNRLAESRIPSTLTAVLQARLDRLSSRERGTMQRASVVGRIFWADAVTYLEQDGAEFGALGGESRDGKRGLQDALETLQGRELVFRRQASAFAETWEYTFKHAILHEVTYESVLKRLRRRYHARAAAWLTEQGRERVEQYAGLIGDHYEQAGEVAQAAKWYGQAGRRAQETCANETALKWYNRVLELVQQLGPEQASELESLQLSAHGSLGDVLALMGWYDEALEHYAAARSLLEAAAGSPDQARRLADLCRQTAEVCERRSEYECASEWLERGLSYLDESEPTIEAARIYLLRAGVYHRQGRSEEAIDWCQKGIAVASGIRTREGLRVVARAYYLMGSIYRLRGDLLRAVRFCRESVQLYQQIEDLAGQSNAYNNLAIAYFEQGDWTEASAVYHESLAIRRKVGDVYGHGIVANNLAGIHLDRGEWIQAAGLYEQGYAIGRQIGAASLEALALSNLAQVHIYQENWPKARDCLSRSQALFVEIGSDEFLPELERRWGELYLRTGELDQALDHARRSIALASAQSSPLEAGMSCRVLGRVHMARDEWEPAEAILRQSLEILSDLNSEYEVAKTRLSLTRLALETGSVSDEARECLAQAVQTFEKLGAQADLAAAREVGKSL
jgi:tetratricopeptide (TPR) repeat protein